ncbi:MAG TPA: ATP-binding protein [Chloroflexota bacterium]
MTAHDLVRALRRLDQRLAWAVAVARATFGPDASSDPFRGLHISQGEVERLLARQPAEPLFAAAESGLSEIEVEIDGCLAWLVQTFGLSAFELEVLLIGLAPEIDLRYERTYAFLQDDVSRRRPTVDLALNLLCADLEVKLRCRTVFAPDAPLLRHRLITLFADPNQVEPPLLAQAFKVDDQVVRLLLGQTCLDPRLAGVCQIREPTATSFDSGALEDIVAVPWSAYPGQPLRLVFQGPTGAGQRQAAERVADALNCRLLTADVAPLDSTNLLKVLVREAWFLDAVLYVVGFDALQPALQTHLVDLLAEWQGVVILEVEQPWTAAPASDQPLGMLVVPFGLPDFEDRRGTWQAHLEAAHIPLTAAEVDALAGRFRMSRGGIAESVAVARQCVAPDVRTLFAAARAQSSQKLAALANKIEPVYTWTDIVLPDDAVAQLRELCQRVALAYRVLDEWGFDAKLSAGKGVNALFAGPSGTGKTMAAEVIANDLGLDLYRVNLAGVVSKYIGETEKNLDRIFAVAADANAVLFFDEADALFGKRSEVRDSHDRYANIEISYLLQKMEQYPGLTILATNLRGNLDDAFTRRLTFAVHFEFPDEMNRARIWSGVWPASTPVAPEVDLAYLAREFPFTGGSIRNIALAAAFLGAEAGTDITMDHLFQAVRREYQKMGKQVTLAEITDRFNTYSHSAAGPDGQARP